MRYATISTSADPVPRLAAVDRDRVFDITTLANAAGMTAPATLLALVQGGRALDARIRQLVAAAPPGSGATAADVRWHAPIPRPLKNVFCMGLNYLAHARESGAARGKEPKLPTRPVLFTKAPTSVTGPYDVVPVDWSVTKEVDWEVELGIVIGRTGRDIARADALDAVFGYTVINDLSAREVQIGHMQWFKGKSLDGFCPMGPVVVTADEFGDPQRKRLQTRVNGVTRQDASTSDMIFPVDSIIEWLSKGLTIEAGDLIATGTPAGVGMGCTPPEYLKDGDVVETEVEGIGILRNRITTYVKESGVRNQETGLG
jgi:2-keto-4-pentenoate hydratase/2-oxohepta-3-ene-1,7-dioic acid hydratase in catechol pathway